MAITGPDLRAAWRGEDLARSGAWIRTFEPAHLHEIDSALRNVRGLPLYSFGPDEFPLPRTAGVLAEIGEELENGFGAVRLCGLDSSRYSEDELRYVFWGLGTHLGTPLYQNGRGEIMGAVRDETRLEQPSFEPPGEGRVTSSRARARSTGPLRWHTDRCDVIALLCARNAARGGVSKLASIVTVYNEIERRRPDLLELLCRDYWRSRPVDEDGPVGERVFAMPVFGLQDGRITSQYSRTYVEQAQENPGPPRLTAAQNEALDLLAAIADEVCLLSPFGAGDIQLLNNHVVYHGRTAYEDDIAFSRLLLRLWLSVPNSRRLPPGFEVLWGSTEPGALRGGVVQPGSGERAPRVLVPS
jgi:hypothetical protein